MMTNIKFKKYDKYRDSGIQWLGKIPEHWQIQPGFKLMHEAKEKNAGMKRKTVLSLSYGKIRVKEEEELTGLVPESYETYQLVNEGDIIFRPTDLQNDHTSLRSGISTFDGIITSAYLNLRIKPFANNEFFNYFFRAIDNNKVIYGLGSGLRQNIDFRDFKRFNFVFPPLEEQAAIARFLDEKTAKIDAAIAKKEKMIALLNERKQIIIQNAVTKGLNPTAKMKDSGIEWIGEIPEHWQVKRLKYLLDEINVRSKSGEEELLSLSKVHGVLPRSSLEERAGQAASLVGYKIVYPENIVINKMQAVNGLIAVSRVYGITSPDYSVYRVKFLQTLDVNYLGLLITQSQYLLEFKRRVTGAMEGFIRLYTDALYDVFIHLPSIEEQKAIVAYVEAQMHKITNAVIIQEKQIEKLKEYKAVLIDSAVTGKIKVI